MIFGVFFAGLPAFEGRVALLLADSRGGVFFSEADKSRGFFDSADFEFCLLSGFSFGRRVLLTCDLRLPSVFCVCLFLTSFIPILIIVSIGGSLAFDYTRLSAKKKTQTAERRRKAACVLVFLRRFAV